MKVYLIEAYSYDPEEVVGVFSSEIKAINFLEKNGWKPCPDPLNEEGQCGCCPYGHWHSSDDWLKGHITEHSVR